MTNTIEFIHRTVLNNQKQIADLIVKLPPCISVHRPGCLAPCLM